MPDALDTLTPRTLPSFAFRAMMHNGEAKGAAASARAPAATKSASVRHASESSSAATAGDRR